MTIFNNYSFKEVYILKNYFLFAFYCKNISVKTIVDTDKDIESVFDLIIIEKYENILSNSSKKSALKKINRVINVSKEWLEKDYLINPSILVGFEGSFSTINRLYNTLMLKNTSELKNLDVNYVKQKLRSDYSGRLKNIKRSYNCMESWLIENKLFFLKELILILILKNKKISLPELINLINEYIKDKDINVVFQEKEIQNLINELIDLNYLVKREKTLFFPENIFYKSEVPYIAFEDYPLEERLKQTKSIRSVLKNESRDFELLKFRLEGKTLQEIGDKFGFTRERARQIQNKLLKNIGKITEVEIYREIFEEYEIDKDIFIKFYRESEMIYNLLDIVLKKGNKNFITYIKEKEDISQKEKMKILFDNDYFLNRFDEMVPIKGSNVFEEILSNYEDEYYTPDEFFPIYLEDAKKYNLINLSRENSTFIRGLVERSKYTISTLGKKFRYFDSNNIDIENLKLLIEILDNYDRGSYSTLKIVNENQELMTDMNIWDEYELHNLFKKRPEIINNDIALSRSPEFKVGNINKKEFILEELISFSGEPIEKFVEYLYSEFGLKVETMKSYLSNNFREYIDGRNLVKNKEISKEDIILLEGELKNIFYLKNEVSDLFKSKGIKFSTYILDKLGYYLSKDIVYKKEYGNGYRAFLKYAKKNNSFIVTNSEIYNKNEFKLFIYRAETKRELVAISPGHYVTIEFLDSKGISKKMIRRFLDNIYDYVSNVRYFTFKKIVEEGFYDSLMEYGFDDYFYERLIISSTNMFSLTRNSPVLFVTTNKRPYSLGILISEELNNFYSGIDIFEFTEYLNTKYATNYDIFFIAAKVQNEKYFYSKELKKIFWKKEDYYNEIF